MAHPKLKQARIRYDYRCGYCGISEVDAGGELTIDHFFPVMAGGDDSENNLIYACIHCNQFKGAVVPDAMSSGSQRRILHPLLDDIAVHIRYDPELGIMTGLTDIRQYNINALHLNRPALTANRRRKQYTLQVEVTLEQSLAEIREIKDQLARDDAYISSLEKNLKLMDKPNE